jgi:DNA-directed RNA polymerase specialized sigma24 family protein
MKVYWSYFGCDKGHEETVQRAWQQRQDQLNSRLAALDEDPAGLQITVSHQEEVPHWNVQAALHLGGRTLISLAEGNECQSVLDDLLSGLGGEVETDEEVLERVAQRYRGLEGLAAFLEGSRRAGRGDVFLGFLTPLVASLRPHVRRELRIRELAAGTRAALDTPADVLDEVLVRAYERFPQRPRQLALDLWLLGLAEQVLDESSSGVAPESLNDRIEQPDDEPADSRRTSWTEWATDQESIERGELLPGLAATDAWDDLDVETKQTELFRLLKEIPRHKRQCLMLHTVNGFTIAEIADFQNRSAEQVRADIEAARWSLEQQFRDPRWLDDIEDRLDPSGRRRPAAK